MSDTKTPGQWLTSMWSSSERRASGNYARSGDEIGLLIISSGIVLFIFLMGNWILSGRGKRLIVTEVDKVQEEKESSWNRFGWPLHLQIIPLLLNKSLADIFSLILEKEETIKSMTLVIFTISFKEANKRVVVIGDAQHFWIYMKIYS